MDSRPIGMFDSGVGGMTVLKEVKKKLPNEKIIYLGDTKRFPYGSKSKETIIELTKRGIEFFIKKDVKAIIIACGTATSQAIDTVSKMYNIPIIGIIEPTVNYILKQKNIKNIGVIATAGTIRSNGWEKALKEKNSELNIINKACPLLAPMAEEGWTNNEVASLAVKEYLKDINNIDALILGCTHYPFVRDSIKKVVGHEIAIIDGGEGTVREIKRRLKEKNLLSDRKEKGIISIYNSLEDQKIIDLSLKLIEKK